MENPRIIFPKKTLTGHRHPHFLFIEPGVGRRMNRGKIKKGGAPNETPEFESGVYLGFGSFDGE